MEVIARAKYIRRTPRKARLVADQVRGLRVSDALAQLEFSPKHAARDVAKAIKSAAANAEHNHNLERDELWLKQILIERDLHRLGDHMGKIPHISMWYQHHGVRCASSRVAE